ncbi:hypothetical protein EV127DRAFT_505388 [Xylaria flabelliformis]|nr:hypothetical protein EV127DRAFT_505388 [Xylaria flabelliformis]
MGGALSSIKAASSGDSKDQLDDALNSLEALALTKMDDFYHTTEDQTDSLLLPINKITGKFSFMQAKASTDSATLQKQISGLISDLAGGAWADAISAAATDIIQDLLGSSSASVQERSSYMINVNPLGGVERLDAYYFAYAFTSQQLLTNAQNVVAACVVKSSVKTDNIDDNTLRVIVNDAFPSLTAAQRAQIYEQLAIIILPAPPPEAKVAATTALEKLYETTIPTPAVNNGTT